MVGVVYYIEHDAFTFSNWNSHYILTEANAIAREIVKHQCGSPEVMETPHIGKTSLSAALMKSSL